MKKLEKELRNRNIQRWTMYCPAGARQLLDFECKNVQFTETEKGELNLKRGEIFLHSNEGAALEAKEWFESLDLYNISSLVVYGVGLAYYYEPVKRWLQEDPKRFLIILEDDLEVIYRLLETDIGTQLIFDSQVWLQYLEKGDEKLKEEKDYGISAIPHVLFLGDIQVAALASYKKEKEIFFQNLENYLHYLKNIKMWHLMEHVKLGKGFFRNFYRNMLDLPKSHLSDKMFNQFKGKPAIICGAGPSLEKNRDLLEKLKDRALIFAGGSSMNVLNSTGFLPHFGVGVDPNWAQYARLVMNQAFEVPYFYRTRMQSEALRSIHGEHIFVRGAGGYDVVSWFEEKFGMTGETLSEGNNVVNFSLSIANALGCNPIIFVGLDLAYTEQKSYSEGVLGHPLYDFRQEASTKGIGEELLVKDGVDGKPIHTLWKWVMEAMWYTEYALIHPELKLINATEGGLGIDGIPNMTLKEAKEKYLQNSYDFDALVHGEIQNSPMPDELNEEGIIKAIGEFDSSLGRARAYCKTLRREFHEILKTLQKGKEPPANLITDEAFEALEKLNQEPAFSYLLKKFNESFSEFSGKTLQEFYEKEIHEDDQNEAQRRKTKLNKRRYEFLKAVCSSNQYEIKTVLEEHALREVVAEVLAKAKRMGITPAPKENQRGESYGIEGKEYTVKDDELKIDFREKLGEKVQSHYESGAIKSEWYQLDGKLHGPSLFFGENGTLLAKCWYVNGKKEGKAWFYYSSGELASRQRFKGGIWTGRQEYYFPNGQVKASLQYQNGKLNGDVVLFHEDGIRYRQLAFKNGKREGEESLWNLGGVLEFQAEYKEDRPIGSCRAFYPSGKIAREVIYDDDSKACSVRQWTTDGTLLPEESLVREDYFDLVSKQTGVLTESLDQIYSNVTDVASSLPKEPKGELETDVDFLKTEMDKLKRIEEQMHQELESKDDKEQIWKTPTARRLMGKQLEEATRKMSEDISSIEETLKLTAELLKQQMINKKNEDEK